jgi:cysteine desulfurase
MTPIYLDNNATTRVADEVLEAMTPYYREIYGNAHSAHALGRGAHDGVESARADVAALLGCNPEDVIFTSCGTEGNALVIRGLLDRKPSRRGIVATSVEHPSILGLLRTLEKRGDITLRIVNVDESGVVDLKEWIRAIDETTLLACVMYAQNETGVVHAVPALSEIAHSQGALMLVDAVQAAGKLPISMSGLGADFLTISGHKFHAPKGVGALAIRKGLSLEPLWQGGGQELGLRSGTEPVPSIVGLGTAARLAREALQTISRVRQLRDQLETSLLAISDTSVNGGAQPRLPNTLNISFHGVPADVIVLALDAEGLCASAGAACHSGIPEPSATMKAMHKPLEVGMGAVRFSLSRYTTAEDIERTAAIVSEVVGRLRGEQPADG